MNNQWLLLTWRGVAIRTRRYCRKGHDKQELGLYFRKPWGNHVKPAAVCAECNRMDAKAYRDKPRAA